MPAMRAPRKKAALAAMQAAAVVSADVAVDLATSYDFLRGVEHRIQMLNDEQTLQLPNAPDRREAVRALSGYSDGASFAHDIAAVRLRAHGVQPDLLAATGPIHGEARYDGVPGSQVPHAA